MDVVFGIILFLSLVFLVLGLIKPKIAFMKSRKKVLIVYPIVLIVSFIGIGVTADPETSKSDEIIPVSGKTDNEKAESKPATKNEEKPKEEKPKEEKPKEEPKPTFKIGDTVSVGKMLYMVSSISIADQVGPEFFAQKANGKYVILEVTLKNNGNDAVTVDSSFFKLKRGEKTYDADTMATLYASQDNNSSFFLEKVNPDSQLTGKIAFDVAPEVAESPELQLQVQTGVFGTEKEVINLK